MTDQPSSATPHTPEPTSAPCPWWRRGSVPYLLGLVVLLPATLATPWWVDHRANQAEGFATPRAAQVDGDTADVAGSTWTFLGMATEDAYPGTQTVDVAFLVRPDDQLAADRLYSHCDVRAVDDGGRTWQERLRPVANMELPEDRATVDLVAGCKHPDYDSGHLPVGAESLVLAHFVVPDDRVADLRFEVEVATNDPEIDYAGRADEDVAEEVDELFDNPEESDDNPREPEVLSFASDTELDYRELDRYTFDVE